MFKKYNLSLFRILQVVIDGFLICVSSYLSYALTEQTLRINSSHTLWIIKASIFMLVIRLSINSFFGLYRQIWRYISVEDIVNVFKAVSLGSMLGVSLIFLLERQTVNKTMFIVDWIICFGLISGIRLIRRYLSLSERTPQGAYIKKSRILLYGADNAADIFIRQVSRDPYSKMFVAGIIDDNPKNVKAMMHGIRVLGGSKEMPGIIDRYKIDELVITTPTIPKPILDNIFLIAHDKKKTVKIMPSIYETLTDKRGPVYVRDIDVSDILERDPVAVDFRDLENSVRGKRILITGGAGSIGSELARQLARFRPEEITLLDTNENDLFFVEHELSNFSKQSIFSFTICDIRQKTQLKTIFEKKEPGTVFHAAAYKHVPYSQSQSSEYILTNVLGTKNLIEIAGLSPGVKRFCFISSDKAVRPANVMGATKAIGEAMILKANESMTDKRFCFVRFGNVLGSRGSVIPLFKRMIENGGPVTVTEPDMERYFMSIHEAVSLILYAAFIPKDIHAFLLDMGRPVKIEEVAKLLIRLSGFNKNEIDITYTGIRRGEKMKEDLYDEGCETIDRIAGTKILAINGKSKYVGDVNDKFVGKLINTAMTYDDDALRKELKSVFNDINIR